NGTLYSYAVWVVHGTDLSAPARITATPDFATPAPVTSLQGTPGDARVDLSWTNPSGTFDAIKVVRKIGSDPTSSTDGTVVFNGVGTSVADTAVANGTSYHYGVWV